jgi:hypothetical protein
MLRIFMYRRTPNVLFLVSKTKRVDSAQIYTVRYIGHFCSVVQKSNSGLDHLIVELSSSHTFKQVS